MDGIPLLNKQQQRLKESLEAAIRDHVNAESVGDGVSLGDVTAVLQIMEEEAQRRSERLLDEAEDSGEGWKE